MDALSVLVGFIAGLLCCASYAAVVFSKLCDEIAKIADRQGTIAEQLSPPVARVMERTPAPEAVLRSEGRQDRLQGTIDPWLAPQAANEPWPEVTPIPASLRKPKCRFCSRVRAFFT